MDQVAYPVIKRRLCHKSSIIDYLVEGMRVVRNLKQLVHKKTFVIQMVDSQTQCKNKKQCCGNNDAYPF